MIKIFENNYFVFVIKIADFDSSTMNTLNSILFPIRFSMSKFN